MQAVKTWLHTNLCSFLMMCWQILKFNSLSKVHMHSFVLKIRYLFLKYNCIWIFLFCVILFLLNQGFFFLFSKKINSLCTFGMIVKMCRSLLNSSDLMVGFWIYTRFQQNPFTISGDWLNTHRKYIWLKKFVQVDWKSAGYLSICLLLRKTV